MGEVVAGFGFMNAPQFQEYNPAHFYSVEVNAEQKFPDQHSTAQHGTAGATRGM